MAATSPPVTLTTLGEGEIPLEQGSEGSRIRELGSKEPKGPKIFPFLLLDYSGLTSLVGYRHAVGACALEAGGNRHLDRQGSCSLVLLQHDTGRLGRCYLSHGPNQP